MRARALLLRLSGTSSVVTPALVNQRGTSAVSLDLCTLFLKQHGGGREGKGGGGERVRVRIRGHGPRAGARNRGTARPDARRLTRVRS
jgi:hypothetical protein